MTRAVVLAVFALAALPAAAQAHATISDTKPARGAKLDAAPASIELRFSEPVETKFGAVRVFDSKGSEVQAGAATHPGGKGEVVQVGLTPGLPDGGYTVTFRVVSADSHPISGGFVFAVGDGPAATSSVGELLEGTDAGPLTTTALSVARAIQYASIALGLGALLFLLVAWLPALRAVAGADASWAQADAAFGARLRVMLIAAAVAGVLSAAAGIVLQGATASGDTAWSALDTQVIGDVLGTRFGSVWGVGVLAWLAVLVLATARVALAPRLRAASVGATGQALPTGLSPALVALGIPLVVLALLPGFGGHASAQEPQLLLLPTNAVHVAAMAAWLGGIAVLVFALRAGTAALEGGDRTRLLAGTVARFSTIAGAAIAVIAVTGVIQSIVYMDGFANLVDDAFGRSVLIKSVLFLVICGLGFVNRNRLLPQLRTAAAEGGSPGPAGVLLRRVLRVELAVGIAVIGVTGALASYAPSTAASAGPFAVSADIGPAAKLDVTVDPASTGLNEMHVYLFARKDGSQYDKVKELTVKASLPEKQIDPIELEAVKSGPGHYTVTGATFGVAGDWTVEIAALVSEFDQYTTKIEVPIE